MISLPKDKSVIQSNNVISLLERYFGSYLRPPFVPARKPRNTPFIPHQGHMQYSYTLFS